MQALKKALIVEVVVVIVVEVVVGLSGYKQSSRACIMGSSHSEH